MKRNPNTIFDCPVCGQKFQRRGKLPKSEPTCSIQCRMFANQRTCNQCGKVFHSRQKRKVDGVIVVAKYCSLECSDNAKTKTRTRYTGNWRSAKNKALVRCDNKCCLCGSITRLQVHHIDGDSNEQDNLTVLCVPCHSGVSGAERALKLYLEYGQTLYSISPAFKKLTGN